MPNKSKSWQPDFVQHALEVNTVSDKMLRGIQLTQVQRY
jgi:hypothetical protein